MQIVYYIRSDEISDQNGKTHTVFGVDAVDCNGNVVRSIQDIFFDLSRAEDFVRRCNTEKLELIHLDDVVYDELVMQSL